MHGAKKGKSGYSVRQGVSAKTQIFAHKNIENLKKKKFCVAFMRGRGRRVRRERLGDCKVTDHRSPAQICHVLLQVVIGNVSQFERIPMFGLRATAVLFFCSYCQVKPHTN